MPDSVKIRSIPTHEFKYLNKCAFNSAVNHTGPKTLDELLAVYYLDHICSSSKSFTKKFNYSLSRGMLDENFVKHIANLIHFRVNDTDGSNETAGKQDDVRNFLRSVNPLYKHS